MQKYKPLLVPAVSILILIVAYVFSANYLIGRINSLTANIDTAKSTQLKLQQKLTLLQSTQANIDTFRDKVLLALPDTNNSLVSLSQIKKLASDNNLTASNISISQSEENIASPKTTIGIDLDGPLTSVFGLVNQLQRVDPITTLDKFKLINSGSSARVSLTIAFYWAPLPTKVPSVVDPEKELTKDEMDTLNLVNTFLTPEFTEVKPIIRGNGTAQRNDPFSAPSEVPVATQGGVLGE